MKLSLKTDEPQVEQRNKAVERKLEYYHIIIFLKGFEILYRQRRGQVKTTLMEHFNTSLDLLTISIVIIIINITTIIYHELEADCGPLN